MKIGHVDVDELLKVGRAAARQRVPQNRYWVKDACDVIDSMVTMLREKHTLLVKDRTDLYNQFVAERRAHAATRAELDALRRR